MQIKGIDVVLHQRGQSGLDDLGNPIYQTGDVTVENVLVAPTTVDDLIDRSRLEGTKELYTMGIPKGDSHVWLENKVTFFGKTWHCYAEKEGIEENIPLAWNKTVYVERYDG
jgi:hypothetical protein